MRARELTIGGRYELVVSLDAAPSGRGLIGSKSE